jgi:hypothetical protein
MIISQFSLSPSLKSGIYPVYQLKKFRMKGCVQTPNFTDFEHIWRSGWILNLAHDALKFAHDPPHPQSVISLSQSRRLSFRGMLIPLIGGVSRLSRARALASRLRRPHPSNGG